VVDEFAIQRFGRLAPERFDRNQPFGGADADRGIREFDSYMMSPKITCENPSARAFR
jgi:hypothetical protein